LIQKYKHFLLKVGLILLVTQHLFYPSGAYAQDFTWWNEKHNWDGVTHWSQYIITNPAYMGPNAIPVPEIRNGTIFPDAYIEGAVDLQFSKGDNTQDLYGKFFYPLLDCKVALQVDAYVVEHFKMTEETRDERFARTYSGTGWAAGDISFGVLVQIIKDRGNWPDILLSANFRTASGGRLHDARFTDGPGYNFDLSFGKTYQSKKKDHISFRPYLLAGFLAWQTHRVDYHQNDAIQYGAGLDLNIKRLLIANQLGGYVGYIGNGDKPLVYRLKFLIQRNKVNYKLAFQQGLHDFKYSSFRVSVAWKFL